MKVQERVVRVPWSVLLMLVVVVVVFGGAAVDCKGCLPLAGAAVGAHKVASLVAHRNVCGWVVGWLGVAGYAHLPANNIFQPNRLSWSGQTRQPRSRGAYGTEKSSKQAAAAS